MAHKYLRADKGQTLSPSGLTDGNAKGALSGSLLLSPFR
jgi:hypothetical protein